MKSLQYFGVGIAAVVVTLACDRILAEEIERITAGDSILAENAAMKLRPSYQDCLNNWFIDERPRIQCAYDEYDFQDTRLNASYKRLMDSLEAAGKLALRAEERKWIRKRRRRCDFGIDPLPDYVVEAADCEVREAAMRATELERRLAK